MRCSCDFGKSTHPAIDGIRARSLLPGSRGAERATGCEPNVGVHSGWFVRQSFLASHMRMSLTILLNQYSRLYRIPTIIASRTQAINRRNRPPKAVCDTKMAAQEQSTPPKENTMQLAEILSDLVSLCVCVCVSLLYLFPLRAEPN
jgi:hypothetical protein